MKYLPLLLLSAVVLAGCNQGSSGQGYLTIERFQAVAPQYQSKPLRLSCPSNNNLGQRLCTKALQFSKSSRQTLSTKQSCPPGSPSWKLAGQLDGQALAVDFDSCNKTNWEQLKASLIAYYDSQAAR